MSLTISFELSDQDLEHFSSIATKAQMAAEKGELDQDAIINATRDLIDKINKREVIPEFISNRIKPLQLLLNMLGDHEWNLPEQDRHRVLGAMAYFTNPDDLIPDSTPGIGFLDDAIMIELATREMEPELNSYTEFCQYRNSEMERRKNLNTEPDVTYDDWVADKRTELHHRMSERRRERSSAVRSSHYGIGF